VNLSLALGDIILFWLACLLAYSLKGFSGFGSALVFIPVAALVFDPRTAIAASPFIDLFVGLAMLVTLRYDRRDLAPMLRLVVGLCVGSVIGAGFAGVLNPRLLLALIGVAVLALGLHLAVIRPAAPRGPRRRPGPALWLGGFAGGLSGGLVGIPGPPVIAAARRVMDKGAFRRSLAAVFLVEGVVRLAVYAVNGVWTPQVPQVALLACPAVLVGLIVGYRSHVSVGERSFNLAIGGVLTLLGLRVLYSVVLG
jgi:uncharacterized membrane protein YfcA